MRDRTAIVGIGETTYYTRGRSPVGEFQLACEAILAACDDAGVDVRAVDGFASYSGDRNDPVRVAAALGIPEIHHASMAWGGGGGGVCAAVANATGAILSGAAELVVVYRGLAQGQYGRFGRGTGRPSVSGTMAYCAPYGLLTPAQTIALRTRRFMDEHGITEDALAAIALVSYGHAQHNPRAVMYGRPLTREAYDTAHYIVEPFRLFDCCLENDGAAAVVLTSAERAARSFADPVRVLAALQGSTSGYDLFDHAGSAPYASANFGAVADRLYRMAGVGPEDVDVAQVYENFTGGVLMSLVEHGFCDPSEVMAFCTTENLSWPDGGLPLNTSGGHLAECYMHGLGLVIESVRQMRGTSTAQVQGAHIGLVAGGPVTAPVSSLLVGRW